MNSEPIEVPRPFGRERMRMELEKLILDPDSAVEAMFSVGNLPTDPVARAEAEKWLRSLKTRYIQALEKLHADVRQMLILGSNDRGIITGWSAESGS